MVLITSLWEEHYLDSALTISAIRSAIMMIGMLVLARGMLGINEPSQTRKPVTPRTRPLWSVTAPMSSPAPMRHVPVGCQVPPVDFSTKSSRAESSAIRCFSVSPSVTTVRMSAARNVAPTESSTAPKTASRKAL